jgi:hypothetical protein
MEDKSKWRIFWCALIFFPILFISNSFYGKIIKSMVPIIKIQNGAQIQDGRSNFFIVNFFSISLRLFKLGKLDNFYKKKILQNSKFPNNSKTIVTLFRILCLEFFCGLVSSFSQFKLNCLLKNRKNIIKNTKIFSMLKMQKAVINIKSFLIKK